MLHLIIKAVSALVLLGFTLAVDSDSGPAETVLFGTRLRVAPNATSKITYRQATRAGIVNRAKARKLASRAGAIQPRQSAKLYPTCGADQPGYLPKSGFASFYPYNIGTNNVAGGYKSLTRSEIACTMLCENRPGCTAGVWYNGQDCALKEGTITASGMNLPNYPFSSFIKGDCASLEAQINDPTIMEACCNNPAPSTVARCTYSGYQNLGSYCVSTGVYNPSNRISFTYVPDGGNPNDFDTIARMCARTCTTWNLANYGQGCTVAVYTYGNAPRAPNCELYGGNVLGLTTSGTNAERSTALYAGTCEQASANGILISPSGDSCYSPTSGI